MRVALINIELRYLTDSGILSFDLIELDISAYVLARRRASNAVMTGVCPIKEVEVVEVRGY